MKSNSILTLVVVVLCAGSAANAKYSGGTGQPDDPYKIETPQDLNDIGNHQEDWNSCFILINDVDLAQYTGTQFKIIGNYGNPFTGIFDGNNNKVLNFTWNSTGRICIGLFAYIGEGADLINIGLENVDVNANVNGNWVGGLVGENDYGTINNCYSTGNVTGTILVGGLVGGSYGGTLTDCCSTVSVLGSGDFVGGLAGFAEGGLISECCSKGTVSGNGNIGGLVGKSFGTMITDCYSTGNVSGIYSVGGLMGENLICTLTNCYSTATVSGTDDVGGLVGFNVSDTEISNCYSSGSVSGTGNNIGGLVGQNGGLVINCFWDIETSGQVESAGGDPKTTAEMKTKSTFTDAAWDLIKIWGIGEYQTYPFLLTEPAGDSNHDKKVDFGDLKIFAENWLKGTKP